MNILPRIPGTVRDKGYVSMESEIKDRLRQIAKTYNCSVSFIQNTIMADALNIKVPKRYYDYKRVVRKFRKTA